MSRGFRGAIGVISDPFQPLVTAWAKEIGLAYNTSRATAQLSLFQTDVDNERILDPVSLQISDAGTSRRRGISASSGHRGHLPSAADGRGHLQRCQDHRRRADLRCHAAAGCGATGSAAQSRSGHGLSHFEPLTPGSTIPGVARYVGRARRGIPGNGANSGAGAGPLLRTLHPHRGAEAPDQRLRRHRLGVSLTFPRFATVDVDLQNALDAKYPEIRASGYLNPGAPRTLRAALRLPYRRS